MEVTLEAGLVGVEEGALMSGSPGLITLEGDALDPGHCGGEVLVGFESEHGLKLQWWCGSCPLD